MIKLSGTRPACAQNIFNVPYSFLTAPKLMPRQPKPEEQKLIISEKSV